jgi:hypothetical protein
VGTVIYLKEKAVYFQAAFLDEDLTVPAIETWIYKGIDLEDGHIFQDASDDTKRYCFPSGITGDVLDKRAFSKWLLEERSPKKVGRQYEAVTL